MSENQITDAQKIEEGAIIDARSDFEAINEWLEKLKQEVHDYEVKNPGKIYEGLSLLTLGYFLGLRADRRINWLLQILSGAAFGYSVVNVFAERKRKKEKEAEPAKQLTNVKIIEQD